jgi:hypothetical protein
MRQFDGPISRMKLIREFPLVFGPSVPNLRVAQMYEQIASGRGSLRRHLLLRLFHR